MKKVSIFLLLVFFSTVSFAQLEVIRKSTFNLKKGIAIEGYDPVSYFNGKPAEGTEQFKWSYKGITYLFASQANLNTFKNSPEKYEPVYGGWCAYAMGDSGEKVKIDPETFKILDDRLYLFYNFWGSNTLKDWNKDEKKLKSSADSNWEKIIR
jgi:YHS domain-containing protein